MVNPGSFTGRRKEFLDSQKDIYAAAVKGAHVADTVADIQRRYFKRFPITLSHTAEPTQEFLDAVDDDAPDQELLPPAAGLDPEAHARAARVYEFQRAELKMRKDQVKRRLAYQYNKTRSQKTKFELGSSDPLAVLTAKLTGSAAQKPRQKTPYNLWGPQNRCFVDPVFNERVREGDIPAKQHAALRSAIYKELFEELPEDEQREWMEKAESDHKEAVRKVQSALTSEPSTAPEDRQRIIESIHQFTQPILDLLADHTGWKVSLIAGGPEPADGGRLNVVSVHSGVTAGTVRMNFGRSERLAYKENVIPTFARFLRKCYSVQDCRNSILPDGMDCVGLAGAEKFDGFEVHTIDDGPRNDNEGQVKHMAPRRMAPSASAARSASSASTAKAASRSADEVPSSATTSTKGKGKFPASSHAKLSLALPSIKFGPPRNHKKADTLGGVTAPPANGGSASVLTPVSGPAVSRAPTPVVSLPASPTTIPSEQTSAAASLQSSLIPHFAVRETSSSSTPDILSRGSDNVMVPPPRASSQVPPHVDSVKLPLRAMSEGHTATCAQETPPSHAALIAAFECSIAEVPADAGRELTNTAAAYDPGQIPTAADVSTALAENREAALDEPVSSVLVQQPEDSTSTLTPASSITAAHAVGSPVSSNIHSGSAAVPNLQDLSLVHSAKAARKRSGTSTNATPASDQKKRRTSHAQPTSSVASTSDGSPEWVGNVLCLFRSADLGPKWDTLVANWLEFEKNSGFHGNGKLSTHRRPRAVADWIQRARSAKFRPEIKNMESFAADFAAWWQDMQPEWRSNDTNGAESQQEGDWATIRRPGINGLLSVVAALFFWGNTIRTIKASPTVHATWLEALQDVSYVIEQLL